MVAEVERGIHWPSPKFVEGMREVYGVELSSTPYSQQEYNDGVQRVRLAFLVLKICNPYLTDREVIRAIELGTVFPQV